MGTLKRVVLGIARDDNSRGGLVYLHESLHVGDVIKVVCQWPSSQATQNDDSDEKDYIKHTGYMKHVYIVGGIGVTAFLRCICRRDSSDNLEVHYAVRSKKDGAYLDRPAGSKTTLYAKEEGQRLNFQDTMPKPTEDILNTSIYCCGPSSLLTECPQLTRALGYPDSRTYFEEFGGTSSSFGTGGPFEAEIKNTQQVLQSPARCPCWTS